MDLTASVDRVPAENLHVSRAGFGAVWRLADEHVTGVGAAIDWYCYGVATTCQWLAASDDPGHRTLGPATQRAHRAMPESIEEECVEADRLARIQPQPAWLAERSGWLDGVLATLNWAWRRTGPPPIDVGSATL